MEFSLKRNTQIVAALLMAIAFTQILYTALYVAEIDVPKKMLWGFEALLFVFLTVFAGTAMLQAKQGLLGWVAIAFSGSLNVVQVGVGFTMFTPFREVSGNLEAMAPATAAVVAFSFFVYNAAKIQLGLAAMVFGRAVKETGDRGLGAATFTVGCFAAFANSSVVAFGRDSFMPSMVAGASGVLATLLLAVCLWRIAQR